MTDPIEFQAWPKIARLRRDVTISEKIDGSNGAVVIEERPFGMIAADAVHATSVTVYDLDWEMEYAVAAQSRKQLLPHGTDNFGFAKWVHDNAEGLVATLGPGRHFGEWWGSGVQRRYGLTGADKRFSLFNTKRYGGEDLSAVPGLGVVPVLYEGPLYPGGVDPIEACLSLLRDEGSFAAPGFMDPEGVVVFHQDAGEMFKVTLKNDEVPKAVIEQRARAAAAKAGAK